jgi:hypothetical protein
MGKSPTTGSPISLDYKAPNPHGELVRAALEEVK